MIQKAVPTDNTLLEIGITIYSEVYTLTRRILPAR